MSEYRHHYQSLNKCNKTGLINNYPLNYDSNDDNLVDYPTPVAVKRTVNPIGCTRVLAEVAELPGNGEDILKPHIGIMGTDESERLEKAELGIDSEKIMCDSVVPETPMESQMAETICGCDDIDGVRGKDEIRVVEEVCEGEKAGVDLICGSNEVVGVNTKDEVKANEGVCDGKEVNAEMGVINEGNVDVDSEEMCGSVVDETQLESQNVNEEVDEEMNASLDEDNMDVDSGGMCDSMVPEMPMESQEVHLICGEPVGVCRNEEVGHREEGSTEMTDSCCDEMGVESEGRSDSMVPETPMESQEMNMTGKRFEVKGKHEVKVKVAKGVQRGTLLGDEAKVKMGIKNESTLGVKNDIVLVKREHDTEENVEEKNLSQNGGEGVIERTFSLDVEEDRKIKESKGGVVKKEVEKTNEVKTNEVHEKAGEKRKISSVDIVNVEDDDESYFAKYKHDKYGYTMPVYVKHEAKVEQKSSKPYGLQDGEYPEEPEWWWPLGDAIVMGRSTTKGKKLEVNELVDIKFCNSWRSNIVRFETKRCGELGTLPLEWAKCLTTLFINGKLKVRGRCIDYPGNLTYHQEIMLSLRCYLHKSLFEETNHACWSLLPTLFKLMGVQPFKQAECTPEYLKSQKRALNLQSRTEIASAVPPAQKRRKGDSAPQITENTDEQALSESTLNKIIGAAEVYHLEEMEPPRTLACDLRPYQKQALYWMCRLESKEDAAHTLHPYYAEYQMCNGKPIYLNTFSGEATMKMPTATDSSRGGILADAMGMGKTVMTIALIHARPGRGIPTNTSYEPRVSSRVKGGTLIVCPMALLGQWKEELETHSEPDSVSVSVHYGGDRTNDPRVMATHDVVLTTYGVLNSAYKSYKQSSIYHMVDWRRVVLDEAHTIKAWKTQTAQAAFALSSHSRWCLTGTPIQNSLEDLYSLFNFMKVEPWCDWNNWRNAIQKPYESGDPIGLTYVKAILKPLMLRRTKETRDKEGSLILELPPIEVKTVECEQSEAEHDFYDALFRRSKVQFDEFLAQGRVLHNYASILELLLRLRQCCNHPFLVMSRSDSQLWDLQKLAKRFLDSNADSASSNSRAYIEEVVEGIQRGDHIECPICLEYADHPVVTPCGHKMCKECLLQSWRNPISGTCPICRRTISVSELIICPSDTRLQIDVEENWRESSKVSMLLKSLDEIRSGSEEKSIVFSQWTSFLDLLEIPLKRKGIGFLRFDGSLTQKQREKVLKEFNETEDKTVLLMSLKAGGVGLNLTAASNVFLMDPWWNPAVEEQAIMRIHRIGQKHTVKVKTFIVKDTVEERLQQVQARKQNMIAGALTDDDVRSSRLEDLKMLFR